MSNIKITRGKKLSETEKAYLAGFIDGEGCINLYRVIVPRMRYELSLSIYNTHKFTMDALLEMIGEGSLNTKKSNFSKSNWLQSHVLKFGSNATLRLLKQVEPFLITKKKQANLAIAFQERKINKPNRFAPLTDEERRKQDETWKQMSILNTNGHKKYSGFHYKALPTETNRENI